MREPPSQPVQTSLRGGAWIALATVVAYANSLHGAFVFDDPSSIAFNRSIRVWWKLAQVLHPPIEGGRTVGGRPVLNFTLALNYAAGGTNVIGYHVVNVLIHLAAALLAYGILRRTLARIGAAQGEGIALGAALLWAVHPLQTEAVTYIVQRAESLMGLFYLLTVYGFIRAADDPPTQRRWLTVSAIACFFGMGTKEVMVSAPVIVLLYDGWFVSDGIRAAFRRRLVYYDALLGSWVLLAGLVVAAHGRGGSSGFGVGVSWPRYLASQFPALAHYLRMAVWPHPLVFDYGLVWASGVGAVLPGVILAMGIVGVAIWGVRETGRGPRLFAFGAIWFCAILAPTSLVPGGRMTLAEHRMYLALLPLLAAGVWALRRGLPKAVFAGVVGVLALAAVAGTVARNRDYRSDLLLWEKTVQGFPDNAFARNDYGGILFREGRSAEAIAQYQKAVRLNPRYAEVKNNWGMVLAAEGRYVDAIPLYQEALRLRPKYPEAELNLGVALTNAGRAQEAIAVITKAIRARPRYAEAYVDQGLALAALGKWSDAVSLYHSALAYDHELPEAHNDLGNALTHEGKDDLAAEAYLEAIRLKPGYSEALRNLGLVYVRQADWTKAQAAFAEAIRSNPKDFDAHEDLGNVLRAQGRAEDAIREYQEAGTLEPKRAEPPFNRGNVDSDLGRWNEAATEYERALKLEPNFADAALNLGVAFAALGRKDEAAQAYGWALKVNPGSAPAHVDWGNLLATEGRFAEAIAQYEAALKIDPTNGEARQNRAQAQRLAQ